MLLFSLIIYLHYDIFYCEEIDAAKFNESILVFKHYQNLVQVNTVLKDVQAIHNMSVQRGGDDKHGEIQDQEGDKDSRDLRRNKKRRKDQNDQNPNVQKNKLTKFHPRSQYDPLRNISDRRQGLIEKIPPFSPGLKGPLVVPRPPSEYQMEIVPFNPQQRLAPPRFLLRPMYPRPMHPSKLLPNYRYQSVYLIPLGPYMPRPLFTPTPAPKAFNISSLFEELASSNQAIPQLFKLTHPFLSPSISNPAEWATSQPLTTKYGYQNMGEDSNYDIYVAANNKRKSTSKDHSPPHSSERTLVPTTTHSSVTTTVPATNRLFTTNVYQYIIGTASAASLFMQDEHGYLYVTHPQKDGTPVPMPHYSKNWESTTTGDIKVQDPSTLPPMLRYLELMKRLDEGYMMVFMIELCRLIAIKNEKDVRQALYHTETIYNHLWNNGRLAWIDEPLQTVIWKLSIMVSQGDIDVVRTYASMMFHMLLRRKQTLSSEVNSILNKADMYNDAEGNQLFNSLKEFEKFPNTTKSSYWLCDSLIESFLRPYRRGRLFLPQRRQELLDAINTALKKRFPRLAKQHEEGKPANGSQPIKKKRKRHRFPYKVMRKRKRHSTPKYNNENKYRRQDNTDMDLKNSILKSMKPKTSDLVKFSAKPPKSFRIKKRPRTSVFFLNQPMRAYSFNKRNKKLSQKNMTPFQEKLDYNFVDTKSDENNKKILIHHHRHGSLDSENYKTTNKIGHHHHQFGRKTATAGHRSPSSLHNIEWPAILASSSPGRLKRARKDKTFLYKMEERLEKSEAKWYDIRENLRARLFQKITVFPTMLRSASSLTGYTSI